MSNTKRMPDTGERYRRLFEEAREGIAITTPQGEIKEVNPAAEEIFGYSREELRSMNAAELYVDPEQRKRALQDLQEDGDVNAREFRFRRADGEEIVCQLSATVHQGEGGEPAALQAFFRDVTERRQAEEALKESEETFRKLAEHALVGIGLLQDGVYKYVNAAMVRMTGFSREALLGTPPKQFVHPEDWPKVREQVRRRERGDMKRAHYETRIVTKSGETRLVEVAGSRTTYQGEPAVIGTIQDITERRQMRRQILRVQEEERKRLGQDLHDGIASQLTGATLKLNVLSSKADDKAVNEGLQEILEILEESATEVRRLSRGLNPAGLSEGDLPSALEGLVQNIDRARFRPEGIEGLELEAGAESSAFQLDGETATHLYRIAQEAVANAHRHGEADEIVVRLRREEEALVLEIEDDGHGFDPEAVDREGLGLRSMRHRAEILDATLIVESSFGDGALVRCRRPA